MFTVEQIDAAHANVKSGADFPKYIQEIKQLGVVGFETFVTDSHTEYYGNNNFRIQSQPQYKSIVVANTSSADTFKDYLKSHQQGNTDYHTFCNYCAETGIEKWLVSLIEMTCTYYDKAGNLILVEDIPA
jgi:uncharacterized protein YbcV (DUF1398 family)